jgi:hypothetical protein
MLREIQLFRLSHFHSNVKAAFKMPVCNLNYLKYLRLLWVLSITRESGWLGGAIRKSLITFIALSLPVLAYFPYLSLILAFIVFPVFDLLIYCNSSYLV